MDADTLHAVIYIAAATLGQVLHAIKKAHGDGDVDTMAQWFSGNPWRTAAAVISNLGVTLTVVSTGAPANLTLFQIVIMGTLAGLGTDAAVNKSGRTQWTGAERAEKAS